MCAVFGPMNSLHVMSVVLLIAAWRHVALHAASLMNRLLLPRQPLYENCSHSPVSLRSKYTPLPIKKKYSCVYYFDLL